jgi:hypothetical protein
VISFKQFNKRKITHRVYLGRNPDHVVGILTEMPADFAKEYKRLSDDFSTKHYANQLASIHADQKEPTDHQADALKYYSQHGYKNINKTLYKQPIKSLEDYPPDYTQHLASHINHIKSYLKDNKAPDDIVVHTGGRHFHPDVKVGDHIDLPAFTSTSLDKDTAKCFASSTAWNGQGRPHHTYNLSTRKLDTDPNSTNVQAYDHVVQIHVPKGTRGLASMEYQTQHKRALGGFGENELLLHPFKGKLINQHVDHATHTVTSVVQHTGKLID